MGPRRRRRPARLDITPPEVSFENMVTTKQSHSIEDVERMHFRGKWKETELWKIPSFTKTQ